MTPIKHLDIAVIGDQELVNALRLVGSSKYHMIKDDQDVREEVRKTLEEFIVDPDVGIIVMLEEYAQYVEDMVAQVRKGRRMTPVIVEVPSKSGTRYPDVRDYYKAAIRESVGFEVEI